MNDEILSAIRSILGPESTTLGDVSWDHRQSQVLKIRGDIGGIYYAKRHGSDGAFERELHAYRTWTPPLGDLAPQLMGAKNDLRLIVVREVPGRPLDYTDSAQRFNQAGQLLRRYHDSGTHRICDFAVAHPEHKLVQIFKDASSFLTEHEVRFVQRDVEEFATLLKGNPTKPVPCHRDFQPRNLLLDDAGTVRVIDFEHSAYDFRERDLIRMYWGCQYHDAQCWDQFLQGYGHQLGEVEQAILEALSSVWAVTTVRWARRHHDRTFEDFGRFILDRVMQSKRAT